MKFNLELSRLKFSLSESQFNRMLITGSITNIGEPSTGAPCGSGGKRVVWTREAVEANHQSFRSMPINCTFPDWWCGDGTDVFTGHGSINIGVIEDTWVEGNDLMAKIVVWKDKFPDIGFMICNGKDALGFSVEIIPEETHNDDTQDGFLYIDKFTGYGCALLWKNVAAFEGTYIKDLVASRRKVDDKVDEKKLQEMLDGMFAKFDEKVTKLKASVDGVKTDIAASNEKIAELKAGIDASVEVTKASIEASKVIEEKPPTPTATQTVVANDDVASTKKTKADRIAEINASTASMNEKIKQITKINTEAE